MTTHSELTRHHRPPNIWRRWIIWTPTIAVGILLSLAAPHSDLAITGAATAALGVIVFIFDTEETP